MATRGDHGRFLRSWTDDDLRAAIASSKTLAGAARILGLNSSKSTYTRIRRAITELGIDTSHWCPPKKPQRSRVPHHLITAVGGVVARESRPDKIEAGRRLVALLSEGVDVRDLDLSGDAAETLIAHLGNAPVLPEWEISRAVPNISSPILGVVKVRRPLTGLQAEALQHLAHGEHEQQIALALGITRNAVRARLRSALWSLDASTKIEAVAKAVAAGLVTAAPLPAYDSKRRTMAARKKYPAGAGKAAHSVLEPLARGLNNREVARELCLAEETVKSYVKVLLRHYGCKSRAQLAVRYALDELD